MTTRQFSINIMCARLRVMKFYLLKY